MRKLLVHTFITLDGVMQAPGGPQEDPVGGFRYGGWSFNFWDEKMQKSVGETMGKPFDLLLGRKTYEIFAAHWPYVKNDPLADQLNKAHKYVVSRTLGKADWENSSIIGYEAVEKIKKLKQEEGPEIQVHGSSDLLQTLIENHLIDEYRIMIFPIVLGKGKKLFGSGTIPSSLKLTHSETSGTGVIIARYEPGGEVKPGSFAFENPTEAELERRRKLSEEILHT